MDSKRLGKIRVNSDKLLSGLASHLGIESMYVKKVRAIADLGVVLRVLTIPKTYDKDPQECWYLICSEVFDEVETESQIPEYKPSWHYDMDEVFIEELNLVTNGIH